ncbi:MAG: lysophospholipid acyltransferase family protein [Bacteroidia bacterium]|nr:lysophospholipid acyltransferase family protein [Bacteroidia bacterium]
MLSPLLFYLFLKPLSLLPWRLIYGLSDFLYVILYHVAGYRKKVVMENLRNSFPEKEQKDLNQIAKNFYAHLCDLIAESIKMFSVSENAARKRMRCINPEVQKKVFESGKDVIVAGGHYNNWEMCGVAVPFMFSHKIIGIFKPLKNKFFDDLMRKSRGKFGTLMIPMQEVKDYFASGFHEPTAVFFIIDQSPSNPSRGYWTTFLNQDTCFMTGAARFAIQYDLPVLFGRIEKVKRGHYTFRLEEVPVKGLSVEEIMEELIKRLEQQIIEKPEFWLWTHRRWKHKREPAATD